MDERAVSVDALTSFAVFAEHLNFTRAAAELRISQPALHVKIRKLAQAWAVRSTTAPARPVVLAAGQGAYLYLLGDPIRAVLAEEPTRLRLITCDHRQMLAAVRTGRAHLGVSVLDVLPDDLTAVELAVFPQVLLVPEEHPLARRRSVGLPGAGRTGCCWNRPCGPPV
jgi:DNA-binding transcriptional LysR family regulator